MGATVTYVENNETLFRRVDFKPGYWRMDDDGVLRVTQSAFGDSHNRPSVDRAVLCNDNPTHTQLNDDRNGVVALVTSEVRTVIVTTNSRPPLPHQIDVIHVPETGNYAHAQIQGNPHITSDGAFQRLRASLAILANTRGWLILPFGFRD
jgi:hypothetical protein